jgi:protein-S-isoprenylcysteine O-methyltransferase Ste14
MWIRWLGFLFLLIGLVIAFISIVKLGQNLTALPHPKDNAQLVTTGIYAFLRHPIYSALIFIGFGWALWNSSLLSLFIALILGIFLDLKSRREEHYLQKLFSEYVDYKKRVKKFVPFVY